MRIFDFFLHRASTHRANVRHPGRGRSRLTVVCPRDALGVLRQQIYVDFSAAGLDVCRVQVNQSKDPRLASACITVNYPPALRLELMALARRLSAHPAVCEIRFGVPQTVL